MVSTVEEGQQGIFDSIRSQESGDDAQFVDSVHSYGDFVAFEFLFEEIHRVQIVGHVE